MDKIEYALIHASIAITLTIVTIQFIAICIL